ncbi:hypothetical protein DL95DRAFT_458517 [Leptodontidium sp. 2 PMI_412]|nr:hypothetical protein DL95DRAFT_458517 [Leptodontidium sp. 2 PMI_412]
MNSDKHRFQVTILPSRRLKSRRLLPQQPDGIQNGNGEKASLGPGIPGGLWAKLPRHIALKIWELASQSSPRLINLTLPGKYVDADGNSRDVFVHEPTPFEQTMARISWAQAWSLVSPSPIIGICRQSREVASTVSGQRIAKPSTKAPTIWFSPEDDTLFLNENTLCRCFYEGPYALQGLGLDLSRVQKLALARGSELNEGEDHSFYNSHPYWRSGLAFITQLIRMFPSLNLVTFVAQFFTPADVKNLIMMDPYDVDRLPGLYKQGLNKSDGFRLDDIDDGAEQVRRQLLKIRAALEEWKTQNGYVDWEIPQIEMGTITTPEKRDAFYKAREKSRWERDTFYARFMLVEWCQPERKVEFFSACGSKVQDMIISYRYAQLCLPNMNIAVMFNGVRLWHKEQVLGLQNLKEGDSFDIVISEEEDDLPEYTGHRGKYNALFAGFVRGEATRAPEYVIYS